MPAISLKCCFLSSLAVLPAFACRQSRGNSKECCHSVLLFEKQKNTAGQKENPSVRRRCVCYTKSAYCLGMYAVLGLCQVLGATATQYLPFPPAPCAPDAGLSALPLHPRRKFQSRGNLLLSPYNITHLHCIIHICPMECCYMQVD